MPTGKDYAELVSDAENAVKAVKNPELRRVAFEKVLDDLLSAGPGSARKATARKSGARKRSSKRKKAPASSKRKGGRGPQAYVQEMVDDDFFKKPKTIAEVKAELENRGHHIAITSLSGPLQKLTQKRVLRRERKKTTGNKGTFVYSNY